MATKKPTKKTTTKSKTVKSTATKPSKSSAKPSKEKKEKVRTSNYEKAGEVAVCKAENGYVLAPSDGRYYVAKNFKGVVEKLKLIFKE